MLDLQVPGANF